ncbi:hypothetical protein MNBD_GAMMA20-2380 [hydrothermal vent metagenome]|uniref:Hemerythrin-like domain-containing protein n=1 Tax=hydrothermal vent metagenome TaxID=652676 RepID=A0A3B1AF16_9ZZZZ
MSDHYVVDPTKIPPIAVASMDAKHHEEVELVNQIGRLIKTGQSGELDSKALHTKLDEWIEHTRRHFAHENRLMKEADFAAYGVHSHEHTLVLARLELACKAWQTTGDIDALANYVFVHWPEWFQGHVASMDTMTAAYLSRAGVK